MQPYELVCFSALSTASQQKTVVFFLNQSVLCLRELSGCIEGDKINDFKIKQLEHVMTRFFFTWTHK